MKHTHRRAARTLLGLVAAAAGLQGHAALAQSPPAAAAPAPAPVTMALQRRPPQGAVVLLSDDPASMSRNWYKRSTTEDASWAVSPDGIVSNNHRDIASKAEFGDHQLHVEFRLLLDANGKLVGEGNSGIGMQGRYEVQICNSYGNPHPGTGDCGALYSQVAPRVNACRRPGEWQAFDIVFRGPRLNADGSVFETPRATVFLNGVLVQCNAIFTGPTGIHGGFFKGIPLKGPVLLQGDHDPVQFRNIWVVPL